MSQHSVADAEPQLDALIDRALAGEGIVITRHGRPVAELKPVEMTARSKSKTIARELRFEQAALNRRSTWADRLATCGTNTAIEALPRCLRPRRASDA